MHLYFKLPSWRAIQKFLFYFLFFGNIAFIAYLWLSSSNYYIVQNPGYGDWEIAVGRLAGLLGEFFLLVELVLIGRIRPLEHLYGFDRLNRFHRWIGYSILSLLLAHPIFLTIGNAISGQAGLISTFITLLATRANVIYAFAAVLIFIYIVFLTVVARKRVRYETWYFTHLLTYVAIGLAIPHQLGTADLIDGFNLNYWYVLNFGVFAFVLLWRWLRPLARFAYHRFTVAKVVPESPDTTSIYITGKHMSRFKFQSGQYANINILARGMWYTHPFSFSCENNGQYVRFTIKNSGDYTSRIKDVKEGTHVIIDGPLGLFVEERAQREKLFFVAGGIGVTPLMSMLQPHARDKKDIVLVYAVRTVNDLVFRSEIEAIQQLNPNIKVIYILGTAQPGYESGRFDKEKTVRLVPDFFDREVFLCGPPPMMMAVVANLKEIGFAEKYLHYEKFSF
ncbi:MAG TPA: ferredoxin reductase family protein [Candidatus Paceibacterota bacterium]|nr:ferredoxin reductase family protein [Candidatus Paceibacterota bacterium]